MAAHYDRSKATPRIGGQTGGDAGRESWGWAMPLVARRKVRQTWRDAVAARAGADAAALVRRYDELCRKGGDEGEAAYRVLEAAGKLWLVDEPGATVPTEAEPGEVPAV